MANFTTYKNLEMPVSPEHYDVNVFNKNAMVIDSEFHKLDLKNQSQDNLFATKEVLNSEISRAIIAENAIQENLSEHITNFNNVDNTSDMDKPVSTAQQNAIDSVMSTHNTSSASHNDIRTLISDLTTRLNSLADSDDTTLDQLSEIVAYIKNNKDLIDEITTSKISISDIVDGLDSTDSDKVLSSKQGNVLKGLITDLTILVGNKVDKISGKGLSTNDYTTAEKNKLEGIASGAEVNVQSDWNVTDTDSDAFIKNKPTIPTVNNGTLTIQKNGTNVQTFTANQSGNATADITVPTKTSELTNDSGFKTTDTTYGVVSKTANGLAPQLPNETTTTKYLRQDGTWQVPPNTDTNTWKANTKDTEGYVSKGSGNANKVWKTDANGNPAWRNDETSNISLTNNLFATVPGVSALDAAVGPVIQGEIDELNSNLINLNESIENINYKYKDISVTIPNNEIVGTTTVTEANKILSVNIVYSTIFFNASGAEAVINGNNRVTIKRNNQTTAQTFTVRVVYI